MAAPQPTKYGKLTWTESLGMAGTLVTLPVAILWGVATNTFASFNKDRGMKRIISDCALRTLVNGMNVPQLQSAFGTTLAMYEKWTQANKLPKAIDELEGGGRLMWIGPKKLERVVLYMHGGAFLLPATDFSLSFWRYVQLELEKKGIEVSFVLFSYTLAPDAVFPTPLKQAVSAVEFLFNAGVKPQNLQLAGDSAGGNLVVQVLSQILHPLPSVPTINLSAPFRGALLISPWTCLSGTSESLKTNNRLDFLSKRTVTAWGAQILADVPSGDIPFAEATRAPEDWFAGVDTKCAERVLITAGGAEVLRDDIVAFADAFKKHHKDAELVVQANGLHEDMFIDFMMGEKKLCNLTPLIIEWLAAGCATPVA